MDNKNMAALVGAFVMLIVGVSLVTVVAGQSNLVAEKTIVRAESQTPLSTCLVAATIAGQEWAQINESAAGCNLTVTNYPSGWKVDDCPLTSLSVTNSSGSTLTLNTDYTVTLTSGVIALKNTTATQSLMNASNATLVSYTYCGDDYVNSSFGRTALDVTIGLFAIALLLGAVGLFYMVLKNEGLTNI